MNRKFRLGRSEDIKRVRRLGKSYAHPLVVLIASPNATASLRVAVVAGRSVGGAVQRNRAKRLLRAAIQPFLTQLEPGWDLLLLARAPLIDARFQQIQNTLQSLLERAGLNRESHVV